MALFVRGIPSRPANAAREKRILIKNLRVTVIEKMGNKAGAECR